MSQFGAGQLLGLPKKQSGPTLVHDPGLAQVHTEAFVFNAAIHLWTEAASRGVDKPFSEFASLALDSLAQLRAEIPRWSQAQNEKAQAESEEVLAVEELAEV